jgi:hypothetical protein
MFEEVESKLSNKDYEEFGVIPKDFKMEIFLDRMVEGTREHILNETKYDIPKSRVHFQILKFIHYAFNLFFILVSMYLISKIYLC